MPRFKDVCVCSLVCLILLSLAPVTAWSKRVAPQDDAIRYSGRTELSDAGNVRFAYSGARVRVAFRGESIGLWMEDLLKENWLNLYIDGVWHGRLDLQAGEDYYPLAEGLDPDAVHTVEVVKATEGFIGSVLFKGFELPETAELVPWPQPEDRMIEFIGDSITCGYGIEAEGRDSPFLAAEENFCATYAWHTARALNADYLVVARSGIGMLRNYNGPREGSPGNLPAIYDQSFFREAEPKWDFSRIHPDVICINLGTNDYSTSGVDEAAFEAAYVAFVRRLLEWHPEAKIVLLMGPMRNTAALQSRLENVVATINGGDDGPVSFFELSKQGKHGYGAHWHPSSRQAEVNATELTGYLSDLMGWSDGSLSQQ